MLPIVSMAFARRALYYPRSAKSFGCFTGASEQRHHGLLLARHNAEIESRQLS